MLFTMHMRLTRQARIYLACMHVQLSELVSSSEFRNLNRWQWVNYKITGKTAKREMERLDGRSPILGVNVGTGTDLRLRQSACR